MFLSVSLDIFRTVAQISEDIVLSFTRVFLVLKLFIGLSFCCKHLFSKWCDSL